jgi:hypothetical protein
MEPADRLRVIADFLEKKQVKYGSLYKTIGDLLFKMIGPIEIKTAEDFSRLSTFSLLTSKYVRYARNYKDGGHEDSLDDLMAYAAMMQEIDELNKKGEKFSTESNKKSRRAPEIPPLDDMANALKAKFAERTE